MKYLILRFFLKVKCLVGACWSPNKGERFVSTDKMGNLSIFGFGETPEEYQLTPEELYFNTDYDKLSRERNTIIDQRTKLPPHLMPYGYLTDVKVTKSIKTTILSE